MTRVAIIGPSPVGKLLRLLVDGPYDRISLLDPGFLEEPTMTHHRRKTLSHREIVANRMKAHEGCEKLSIFTRQQDRVLVRHKAIAQANADYFQQPRSFRRRIAFARIRRAAVSQ